MKIDVIVPALPPQMDAIGHYTACVAEELAKQASVRILTGKVRSAYDPIPGVAAITPVFSVADTASVWRIADAVTANPPDWALLQYNPFMYGRWGLNLHLPNVLRAIKRRCPHTRVAVMTHETFVDAENLKFAVMTTWQRYQYYRIGRSADLMFLSIEPLVDRFRRWFPGKPVLHLPVGSTMPYLALSREAARERLGIPADAFIVGLFGTAHYSRMLDWVGDAVRAMAAVRKDVRLLYIGPDAAQVRPGTGLDLFADDGPLAGEEVSRRFAAMDLCLAPYLDGVSTRRSAFNTGLQHGIASVGTRGIHTDAMLLREDSRAFFLSPTGEQAQFNEKAIQLMENGDLRRRMGQEAQGFYERSMSTPVIAQRILTDFQAVAAAALSPAGMASG